MSSRSKTTSKSFVTKGDLIQQPLCKLFGIDIDENLVRDLGLPDLVKEG